MRFYTNFQFLPPRTFRFTISVTSDGFFWEPNLRAHLAWVLNAYLPTRTVLQIVPPTEPLRTSNPIVEHLSYRQWQNIMYGF